MAYTQNKPIVEVRDTPAHCGSHRLFARNFAETGERFTWFSLRWRNNGRTRVLLALKRFRSKDGTHDESRPRVGPRPTAERVQQQPSTGILSTAVTLQQRQQSENGSSEVRLVNSSRMGRSSSNCRHHLLCIPLRAIDALDQQPDRHGDQRQGQGCNHIWQVVLRQDDNQEVFDDETGASKDKDRAKRARQVAGTQNQVPAHYRRGAIEY